MSQNILEIICLYLPVDKKLLLYYCSNYNLNLRIDIEPDQVYKALFNNQIYNLATIKELSGHVKITPHDIIHLVETRTRCEVRHVIKWYIKLFSLWSQSSIGLSLVLLAASTSSFETVIYINSHVRIMYWNEYLIFESALKCTKDNTINLIKYKTNIRRSPHTLENTLSYIECETAIKYFNKDNFSWLLRHFKFSLIGLYELALKYNCKEAVITYLTVHDKTVGHITDEKVLDLLKNDNLGQKTY